MACSCGVSTTSHLKFAKGLHPLLEFHLLYMVASYLAYVITGKGRNPQGACAAFNTSSHSHILT